MAKIQNVGDVFAQMLALQKKHQEEFKKDILEVYKKHVKNKNGRRVRKDLNIFKTGPYGTNPQHELSSIVEEPQRNQANDNPIRTSQRSAAKRAVEKTSILLKQTLSEKLRNPDTGKKSKKYNFDSSSSSIVNRKLDISKASAADASERGSEKLPELNSDVQLPSCVVILNRCDSIITGNEITNNYIDPDPPQNNDRCNSNDIKLPLTVSSPRVAKISLNKNNTIQKNKEDSSLDLFVGVSNEVGKSKEPSASLVAKEYDLPKLVISSPKLNIEMEPISELNNSVTERQDIPIVSMCDKTIPIIGEVINALDETKKADDIEFIAPNNSIRPTRTRTKNKKYTYVSCSVDSTSNADLPSVQGNTSAATSSASNLSVNNSTNSKRGQKRKSEEDCNIKPTKSLKLKENEAPKVAVNQSSGCSDVSTKSGKSPLPANLGPDDKSNHSKQNNVTNSSSGSDVVRSRTKVLSQSSVKNLVVINSGVPVQSSEQEKFTKPDDIPNQASPTPLKTPVPAQRMTRTRTREMNKNQNNLEAISNTENNMLLKCASQFKSGKENKVVNSLKLFMSSDKKFKTTPLATNNTIFSPTPGKSFNKSISLKFDSAYKKNDGSSSKTIHKAIPQYKKVELMKAKTEQNKRKREEKEQRILAHKQAVERMKQEKLAKLQKEQEERDKLLAESKRLKEERLLQKKQNAEVMLKEAEERRLKEEEIKQARIKKQEEEKQKQAELRMKHAEEAKKLHEMRLVQEAKEKQARLKEAENLKKAQFKQKAAATVNSYDLTPDKGERVPVQPKSENDYGLPDNSDDSTDDEKQPKKIVPKWATKQARSAQIIIQSIIHMDLISSYFPLVTDGVNSTLISHLPCLRQRNSSAIWSTPDTSLLNH